MKHKRKWSVMVIGLSLGILLTACGNDTENVNIKEGMEAIELLDYKGAMEYFAVAGENGEDERLIARGKGIASMGLTDYEGAISYFKECLSYSDGMVEDMDFDVNYYLAAAHCKAGEYGEAEKVYNAILAMHQDVEAYFLRGNARLEQGNVEGAISDFELVMSMEPEDYDMRIQIYEILEAHGMKAEGLEYLQTALEEKESKMSAYDKGRIYFYLEDYLQACVQLEAAKKLGTADVYFYLGRAYEATEDYNYAITNVYTKYLNQYEGDARIYNQLGLCYMRQGQYGEALAAFQAAMQIPDNGMMQSLQFNEIVAYEFLGEFENAAALMNRYLKIYPDDELAQKENEFLSTR